MHVARRSLPVDAGLGGIEFVGVGDPFVRLGLAVEAAALTFGERLDHESGTLGGKCVVQLAGRLVRADRDAALEADRSRVEAFSNAHDGDAGLAIARYDGAVDGGGATPARQQRGVEVE